jgi:hypothetical protein
VAVTKLDALKQCLHVMSENNPECAPLRAKDYVSDITGYTEAVDSYRANFKWFIVTAVSAVVMLVVAVWALV